jgi:hypothetical protein
VAEFRYQPTRWPHPYRFVVIRRPQPDEPTAQLTLFKLGRYHYQVLVTNLPLQPLNLWRFYNCAYRSIVITQIGPSRSPGSADRDHRDRHRDHGDRSIVITPPPVLGRAFSLGRMAGA